ncbi:MAG: hypothetical protein KY461_13560 [Actinobacteria bacterium]|nr:hypothetical protein [Actinomycetota bacterium]
MDAAAAGRPSDVSRDRLARRVRSEVADVRVRLEETVLRSDALLATGQPERAAAVLDEQHALLAELQDSIASAVAAAAVEAEAEAVLFGAPDGPSVFARPQEVPTEAVPGPRRVRVTASAVASAVAVLALLILGAPVPSPSTTAAVDADDVVDDRVGDAVDRRDADPDLAPGVDTGEGGADQRALGTDERGIRRPATSPAGSPQGDADPLGVTTSLSELQELVDQFVASVVRVAGGIAAGDAPAVADALDPRQPQPSDDEAEPVTRREPEDTEPASSGSSDRPADANERDAASDRADEEPREDEGADDEDADLPLPSENGNAANPGIPELPE